MLYHNNEFLIPTTDMYVLPSGEAYSLAKEVDLSNRDPHYAQKSTQEKWIFLIDQFSNNLPDLSLEPDQPLHEGRRLSKDVIQTRLEEFKQKRLKTIASHFNLSLEQCVNYFEDFLFLSTNEDSRFKLSKNLRNTLLTSILEP